MPSMEVKWICFVLVGFEAHQQITMNCLLIHVKVQIIRRTRNVRNMAIMNVNCRSTPLAFLKHARIALDLST